MIEKRCDKYFLMWCANSANDTTIDGNESNYKIFISINNIKCFSTLLKRIDKGTYVSASLQKFIFVNAVSLSNNNFL